MVMSGPGKPGGGQRSGRPRCRGTCPLGWGSLHPFPRRQGWWGCCLGPSRFQAQLLCCVLFIP